MKKNEFKYDINDLIINGDKEATMFPFAVGNIYSFTLSERLFVNYYCPLNRKAVSPTSWKPEVGFAFYIGQAPLSQNRAFEEEI